MIVNETFARLYWPDEDPIGHRITVPWGGDVASASYEVVGVVGEVRHQGPLSEARPTLYLLRGDDKTPPWLNRTLSMTVRARGNPLALAEAARRIGSSPRRWSQTAIARSAPRIPTWAWRLQV